MADFPKVFQKNADIHGEKTPRDILRIVSQRDNQKLKENLTMGMASSQARLLTLTARMHDVEFQAQSIQNAKISLANQEDAIYQRYLEALDATTLTLKDNSGNRIIANFNNICGIASINNQVKEKYVIKDEHDRILVPDEIAHAYEEWFASGGGNNSYEFAMFMVTGTNAVDAEYLKECEEDYYNELSSSDKGEKITKLRENMDKKRQELIDVMNNQTQPGNQIDPELDAEACKDSQTLKDQMPAKGIVFNDPDIKAAYNDLVEAENAYYNELYNSQGRVVIYEKALDLGEIMDDDFQYDEFSYYERMFKAIQQNGGRYCPISEYNGAFNGDANSDSDWLKSQIECGKFSIYKVNTNTKDKSLDINATSVGSDNILEETTTSSIDKTALAKAEAEYEHDMKQIDRKDKKFDMDLNRLETERTALKTEYDSVKKVIEDNIERTFGIFS